jgi:hypothetical protein
MCSLAVTTDVADSYRVAHDWAMAQFEFHDMTVQLPSRFLVRLALVRLSDRGPSVNAFVRRFSVRLTGVEITLPDRRASRDLFTRAYS